MNETIYLAQTADPGAGFGVFLPLIALFLIMYALVIRPQQRQQKEHREMLDKIARNDQVVTSGGVHGKVVGLADDVLTLEIAERVRIKIDKSAIGRRISSGGADTAVKKEKSA